MISDNWILFAGLLFFAWMIGSLLWQLRLATRRRECIAERMGGHFNRLTRNTVQITRQGLEVEIDFVPQSKHSRAFVRFSSRVQASLGAKMVPASVVTWFSFFKVKTTFTYLGEDYKLFADDPLSVEKLRVAFSRLEPRFEEISRLRKAPLTFSFRVEPLKSFWTRRLTSRAVVTLDDLPADLEYEPDHLERLFDIYVDLISGLSHEPTLPNLIH